jgi:DNA modification methylase
MLQYPDIYVFDTSSFIKLKDYPNDLFIDLWERIEDMIGRRIRAPIQVYEEIKRKDDEITKFVEKYKDEIFVDPYEDGEIMENVSRIIESYPNLIKSERVSSNNECADPYVIAMAKVLQVRGLEGRAIIVTEDIRDSRKKISIRSVCITEGIECITLLELFRREGWKFTII